MAEVSVDAGLKSITEGRKSRHLDLLDVPLESSDLVYVVCSMPPYRLGGMNLGRSSRQRGRHWICMQERIDVSCISRNWPGEGSVPLLTSG